MKIFYDPFCFTQKYGGVPKYFAEVIKRLSPAYWEIAICFSNNQYLNEYNLGRYHSFFKNKEFRGKGRTITTLNKPIAAFTAIRKNYDIYHQTHYNTFVFPFIPKYKKIVTTIHDLNYDTIPQFYPVKNKIHEAQKKSAIKADHIIAVSHNTKKDIVRYWNIDEKKITVIHHGVDKNKKTGLNAARLIPQPYILYVGTREKFKNFDTLVKAFSIVSKKYNDLHLICSGREFNLDELHFLQDNEIVNKAHVVSANEDTMARLYRDAELFVYPSFAEGFGLPVLEAMVYDCPVVLSNASCFPEIAQSAGIYFDPYSIADMADKILLLLEDGALRKQQIALGKERLTHFSWEKSAGEHLSLYQSLC